MKITYQVDVVLKHNKDGSFSTQAARRVILRNWAKETGKNFRKLELQGLKPKHIQRAVKTWQEKGLSAATIKNRVSHLRWLSQKINKANIIPRDNKDLGIEDRKYLDNTVNKAKDIQTKQLERFTDRQQLSLQLQRAFGLRREESLKFSPSYADKGNKIVLKGSWCKGGRVREIPVRTAEQRELLRKCHAQAKDGSMIAKNTTYVRAMNALDQACKRAELKNMHGHRHAYAQERFKEIAGFDCPKAGGKTSKQLTTEEKQQDQQARLIVSNELGHNREEITINYLGR